MIIIGIDPSLVHTGLCRLTEGKIKDKKSDLLAIKSKAEGTSIASRFPRMHKIVEQVIDFCIEKKPDLLVIEGYAFRAKGRVFDLGEFGGLLREALLSINTPIIEIEPTKLKKFITGKGRCEKEEMMVEVFKRYKLDFDDDNLCDAFSLAIFVYSKHCIDNNIPVKLTPIQIAEIKTLADYSLKE